MTSVKQPIFRKQVNQNSFENLPLQVIAIFYSYLNLTDSRGLYCTNKTCNDIKFRVAVLNLKLNGKQAKKRVGQFFDAVWSIAPKIGYSWGLVIRTMESRDRFKIVELFSSVAFFCNNNKLSYQKAYDLSNYALRVAPKELPALVVKTESFQKVLYNAMNFEPMMTPLMDLMFLMGADANAPISWRGNYRTLICIAATMRNSEAVKYLFNRGALTDGTGNNDQVPPLHLATQNRDSQTVQFLIDFAKVNVNQIHKGKTPLIHSLENGDFVGARKLIQAKADVNLCTEDNSPLGLAAKANQIQVMSLLLDAKANVDSQPVGNWETPLMCAAQSIAEEPLELLLKSKPKIHWLDRDGNSCLHHAAETGLLRAFYAAETTRGTFKERVDQVLKDDPFSNMTTLLKLKADITIRNVDDELAPLHALNEFDQNLVTNLQEQERLQIAFEALNKIFDSFNQTSAPTSSSSSSSEPMQT